MTPFSPSPLVSCLVGLAVAGSIMAPGVAAIVVPAAIELGPIVEAIVAARVIVPVGAVAYPAVGAIVAVAAIPPVAAVIAVASVPAIAPVVAITPVPLVIAITAVTAAGVDRTRVV